MERSSVSNLGEQKIVVIQKQYHDVLSENNLLDKKLKITLTFEDLDDS